MHWHKYHNIAVLGSSGKSVSLLYGRHLNSELFCFVAVQPSVRLWPFSNLNDHMCSCCVCAEKSILSALWYTMFHLSYIKLQTPQNVVSRCRICIQRTHTVESGRWVSENTLLYIVIMVGKVLAYCCMIIHVLCQVCASAVGT